MSLTDKHCHLKQILSGFDRVAVAFSGGVDSTLLLRIAVDVLGAQQVLALTANSALNPSYEFTESRQLAELIGVRQLVLQVDELEVPGIVENQPRRCYHCKLELFSRFLETARQAGFQTVLDGSNVDDLADYRPGRDAIKELQIRSPLLEAGFHKTEVRTLSKQLGLPTWDKQPLACLASRIPYGEKITREKLQQIDRCEDWLRQQGLKNYRVRHHHQLARIEVPETEIKRLLDDDFRQQLVTEFRQAGFSYITLDLQGYRTGSLNETLPDKL